MPSDSAWPLRKTAIFTPSTPPISYAFTYRLIEKIKKVSLFYFFVLQLAKEEIIKTTERTVPTKIAGNIWTADSLKNL